MEAEYVVAHIKTIKVFISGFTVVVVALLFMRSWSRGLVAHLCPCDPTCILVSVLRPCCRNLMSLRCDKHVQPHVRMDKYTSTASDGRDSGMPVCHIRGDDGDGGTARRATRGPGRQNVL